MRCNQVVYWHVELESHEIIFAEGLPSESYFDSGNRGFFVESAIVTELHPALRSTEGAGECLPLVQSGPDLVRAKAALLAKAVELGHAMEADDDLHIVADGRRINPARLGEWRVAFLLPAGKKDITLRSRTFVPAHCFAELTDRRALGVYVSRLQIDGPMLVLTTTRRAASAGASSSRRKTSAPGAGQLERRRCRRGRSLSFSTWRSAGVTGRTIITSSRWSPDSEIGEAAIV